MYRIKRFVTSVGIVMGLIFMYAGTFLFIEWTSQNRAYKDATYVSKVWADLKFYHDSDGQHEYFNDEWLYSWSGANWSSSNYPVRDKYKSLRVTGELVPVLPEVGIQKVTEYIHIYPPIRNSH